MDEELSHALLDVRKAYRLLYFFQRRILDLVDLLSQKLGKQFYYWLPSGDSEAILASKSPFERSAWKMLPMQNASFLFLPPEADRNAPRKGEWLLELLLYDDGEPDDAGIEPSPADFVDPAASHSKIYLSAFIIQEDLQKNWFDDVYEGSEWPELDEMPWVGEEGVRVVGLSIDLASLPDPLAVQKLADRFRELVKAQGGNVA